MQLSLYGGRAHIGAFALFQSGRVLEIASLPGHLEEELAASLAREVSLAMNAAALVAAGIHFDGLQKFELADIYELCAELRMELLKILVQT